MPEDNARTRQAETRKLAAIMFTDMVGFSRQMGADEARTLRLLEVHNHVIQQAVTEYHGHVIKIMGDGFLVDFPSVVHAVQCAQQVQTQFRTHNAEEETTEQIHVRIGIHLGDIVHRDGDVFGDGVNIASRLQALAEPDTVCISDVVYRDVAKKVALGMVVSLGRPKLKNIAERFRVYALLLEAPTGLRQTLRIQRLKLSHRVRPAHQVVVAGLVLVVATIVAVRYLSRPPLSTQDSGLSTPAALPLPDKPSIVVLPFTNMSGDPEQEYFNDGITDTLITDLSQLSGLFVIARNSAFTYKGKPVKVQEVSKELGVRYVLEGSVQKANNRVRINVQLIDATTSGHVWAERYDRELQDIFALQDEVTQRVVAALQVQLTEEEQKHLVRKTTDSVEAYDSLLRGRTYYFRYTQEANAQARQMFERAIELDSQYADAYALLGFTYWLEWVLQWSPNPAQSLERFAELAHQAIALDDSLPAPHVSRGYVYLYKDRQYEQGIAELQQAVSLAPNNAEVYFVLAEGLNIAGRPAEALGPIQKAMRLNPHYPAPYPYNLGWAYQSTGRYTEAIATLKEAISLNPNFLSSHLILAVSYVRQWISQQSVDAQTLEQALAAAQRGIALNDSYPLSHWVLGYVHLFQKQYEQAIAEMERAIVLDPNDALSYAFLAEKLSRVGRSEEAVGMVEQALRRKPLTVDTHLNSIGIAYDLAGRPEEAIAPLQRYLTRYPNFLGAHLTLAAVYSELGQAAEARAEAAEVLRLNPQFSLELHRQRMPIKDPAMLERHLAALRKAGLK